MPTRVARRLASCIVLTATLGGPSALAQQAAGAEEAFVEVRLQRGPSRLTDALVRDSTMFLSLRQFQQLVEVRTTDFIAGRSAGTILEPAGTRIIFNTEERRVRKGDSLLALPSEAAVWHDRELFVATDLLARAFGVIVTVDWVELLVVVRGADHLPAVRRLERARRRLALSLRAPAESDAISLPVRRSFADGAVLDWGVSASTSDPLGASSLDLGLGAQVAGGSLDARLYRGTHGGFDRTITEASWTGAWPENRWVRQLHLGDGFTAGRDPRQLRGASVTNAPFVRVSDFASEAVGGRLPEGSEVELYQGGRLVGFTTADDSDAYRFDVPVRYGPNLLELVVYAPDGNIHRVRRTYVVSPNRLPAGQFEYAIAAGRCVAIRCFTTLNADMRYGVTRNVTVQVGWDHFWRDTLPDLAHPYATLAVGLGRALNVSLEGVANRSISSRVEFAPTPDFEASVRHTEFTSPGTIPVTGSAGPRRQTRAFVFWRPGGRDRAPFVRLTAWRDEAASRLSDAVRVSTTTRLSGTYVEIGAERRRDRVAALSLRTVHTLDLAASGVLLGPVAWARSTFLRGQLGIDLATGLSRAGLRISRAVVHGTRVELETGWRRGVQGFTIELTVTSALRTFRAISRNTYSAFAGLQGNQRVEGSLLWDHRNRRVAFADGRSVGRAGLAGDVFLDENVNGRRDPGEEGVPHARLRVGPRAVHTDSTGRFATWDLVPFEPVPVEIDSLSIGNPQWIAARPILSVVPGPNSFSVVEIPLIRAGELSGRVVFEGESGGVGGVRLELRERETGAVAHATTFGDGAFLFYGVRPGSYDLRPAPEQLRGLGATADALAIVVPASGGPVVHDNLIVRLERPER